MNHEETTDYSTYSDAALQDLLDSAESDSEIREAVQQELQKRRPVLDEEEVETLPAGALNFATPKKLPYKPIGSILWPLITFVVIAGFLGIAFKLLYSWGEFDPKLYYAVAAAVLALLSPSLIISGIRDLANQKADPSYRACLIRYYAFAILWFAAFVYSLYITTRFAVMFYKFGIAIMIYYALSKLLMLFVSFFMQSIFFILARELGRKNPAE